MQQLQEIRRLFGIHNIEKRNHKLNQAGGVNYIRVNYDSVLFNSNRTLVINDDIGELVFRNCVLQ